MKKRGVYYRGVKKFLVFSVIFLILQEALALAFPLLLKDVADKIYLSSTQTSDIVTGGVLVLGTVVLIFIINFCSEFFIAIATGHYQKKMRSEMFEKLREAPTEKINEMGSGEILPLFMNDTSWLRNMEKQLLIFYVYFPVTILGSILMLFLLEPIYALFALASVPLILVFFFVNSRRVEKTMQKSIPAFDEIHNDVKEGIIGAKEIRVYGKAKERGQEFSRRMWWNRVQSTQTQQAIHLSTSFNALLYTITTVAIIIYGAYTMTDASGLIVINTCFHYAKKLFDGSHYIFTLFVDYIPRVRLAKTRVKKIYGLPVDVGDGGKFDIPVGKDGTGLEFAAVGYKHANNFVGLTGVNIKVEPGTRVAITGAIGSGRTIIPELILRNIKPSSGRLLIGGIDISEINSVYYRRNVISFCSQEPTFIPGTVRDNLKMFNPAVTDKQIIDLFNEIGAQGFIKKFKNISQQNDGLLPASKKEDDFLNFEILENSNFNASTKKLLHLVRSLLKDAPIYVFNQCFGHISSDYIGKIMGKLERDGKTCIFISQTNLVSMHCDKIYVLKNGRVSGEGKHSELVKNNSDYKELFAGAAGQIISEATI